MAFVDELEISIKAGKGGDGVVRWMHEKGKEKGGPAGGNGGHGGDVYVRAVRDLGILSKYRNLKKFEAEDGGDGMKKSMHGKNGEDLVIDLPLGSIVKNLVTGKKISLEEDGQTAMVLKGGKGGLGNEHFKSSKNVRPKEFTLGKPGEEANFFIELELVADLGLVGFPNAGKSSLLNELSRAKAKVGSYQFTTLEPNLGEFYGFILADIPGLIEGASEGKGLGHKFLRHIKRTKALLHCISSEEKDILKSYKVIRDELKSYSKDLVSKEEILVLTKSDTASEKELAEKKAILKKETKSEIFHVSILDDKSLKEFKDNLVKILRKLK